MSTEAFLLKKGHVYFQKIFMYCSGKRISFFFKYKLYSRYLMIFNDVTEIRFKSLISLVSLNQQTFHTGLL